MHQASMFSVQMVKLIDWKKLGIFNELKITFELLYIQ
jgi:hypothetical protein